MYVLGANVREMNLRKAIHFYAMQGHYIGFHQLFLGPLYDYWELTRREDSLLFPGWGGENNTLQVDCGQLLPSVAPVAWILWIQ